MLYRTVLKTQKLLHKMINLACILKNPSVRNDIYHYLYHIPSSNDQKLTIQGWPLKYAFKLILEKSDLGHGSKIAEKVLIAKLSVLISLANLKQY